MKLSSLKQQIEELDAAEMDDKSYWTGKFIQGQRNILFHHHGPELLRRLLAAEEALKLFASDSSWRINGVCDPNSGRFEGQTIATAALATIRGEEE